jgi:hypothetical protein
MILAATLAAVLSSGAATMATERTVTKAAVYLVSQPSFLAPRSSPIAVQRGEKVRLEEGPKGSWLQVSVTQRGKKVVGFVHASYLSDRPVAFRVEAAEVEGRSTVSGHYNLAVGGFREEVAKTRQQQSPEAKKGYAVIERYLPLRTRKEQNVTPAELAKLASPVDSAPLLAFLAEGGLRGAPPPPAPPKAVLEEGR